MLGRRHWHIAVPAAAVLTLVPYMVSVYQRGIYVQTTYMNAYSDIPMGLLFGAGLVLYFAPRKKTPVLMTGAVLAVTASCLSMGFALCLIAAAIICFDLLFVQKEDVPFFRLKGLGGKLCWCASLVGAPLAAFFGWAAHMSVVLGSNRFDIGGSADMGMVQMVTTGIAELLGIGRTQKFTDIMELMKSAFFNTRLTMFSVGAPDSTLGRIFNGSGFITVLLILSILLAAFLLFLVYPMFGLLKQAVISRPGRRCGARWALRRSISSRVSPMCMCSRKSWPMGWAITTAIFIPIMRAGWCLP